MKEPTQPDHYRTLGLNVKATKSQIKQTFNKLAKKWHPDKNTPSKQIGATTFFQQLRDAYDTLTDAEQRKAYDAGYASIKALWDAYDRQAKVLELKKAKRSKFSQSMVVLRSATEDFSVHEHIITSRSEYMQRRLEKVAADENNKRILDMTDEEGDVICAYVN
ncbi:hypothetical protein AC578_10059 [Pseudocercospora eumusae]|uniref:J domain-containing protein n=1 Tax=Pseudocercospora eumusae TaxID=321146 RepID=A0A139H840_9PEZI|nr:hypothetical protein AC578_10059 [Pseudocercospora eumusae]KXS98633.1 hypothetical protein AC578_10059 [Pseudocercospora eumusae]